MKDLKIFAQAQQNVFAKTVTDFIKDANAQGWVMLADDNGNPVHLSRAGNPQVAFQNAEEQRIYLRISTNLEAALRAGEKVSLKSSPVYEIALTQGPAAGKTMLVIGIKADSNLKPLTKTIDLDSLVLPNVDKVGVGSDE